MHNGGYPSHAAKVLSNRPLCITKWCDNFLKKATAFFRFVERYIHNVYITSINFDSAPLRELFIDLVHLLFSVNRLVDRIHPDFGKIGWLLYRRNKQDLLIAKGKAKGSVSDPSLFRHRPPNGREKHRYPNGWSVSDSFLPSGLKC